MVSTGIVLSSVTGLRQEEELLQLQFLLDNETCGQGQLGNLALASLS